MEKTSLGRVVLIHGVRTRRNNQNLHRLAAAFRELGFCVTIPRYGYLPAFVAAFLPFMHNYIASSMSNFIEDDDIVLGHSNGATLTYLISQKHQLRGAILLNPALDCEKAPEAGFVHVYHTDGDCVVTWSALVPFHPWGAMGAVGYTGTDPRVTNIDMANPPIGLPAINGHSEIFRQRNMRPWSKYIAALCKREVTHRS